MIYEGQKALLHLEKHRDTTVNSKNLIDQLFSRADILRTWYDSWVYPEQTLCAASYDQSTEMPLIFVNLFGKYIPSIAAPTNEYQWHAPIAGSRSQKSAIEIAQQLITLPRWHYIKIQHIDIDEEFWRAFLQTFQQKGFIVSTDPTMRIGIVEIGANQEEYCAKLHGDFRRELKRRWRQLEHAYGACRVVVSSHAHDIGEAFKDGAALEKRGWKGAHNTAMNQNPQAFDYFMQLAQAAAAHKEVKLIRLQCAGATIAFLYYLIHHDEAYLLKTAYDEGFSRFGPGQLAVMKSLEVLREQGVRKLNFFGQLSHWHIPWQPTAAQYSRLVIARPHILPYLVTLPYRGYAQLKKVPWLYRVLCRWRGIK